MLRAELSLPADNDTRPVLGQFEFHFRRLSCAPGVRIADPIRVFLQSGLPAEIAYRHRHAAIEGDGRLHHFRHYPVENGHHHSFARPVRAVATTSASRPRAPDAPGTATGVFAPTGI